MPALILLLVLGQPDYRVPRELKYGADREGTTDSADSVMACGCAQNYCLLTHFYPIGWSADGKFAYISLFDDHGDAYGYINCQVIVVDAGRNEIAWSCSPPDTENPSDTPFRKIWHQNQAEIEENLKRFAIVQDSFYYQDFPIFNGSDTVDYAIDTTMADMYGWELIDSLKFILRSAKKGDQALLAKADYAALGVSVPGFLKNPRGPEIVIPLIAVYLGWEGPPNTTSLVVLGGKLP